VLLKSLSIDIGRACTASFTVVCIWKFKPNLFIIEIPIYISTYIKNLSFLGYNLYEDTQPIPEGEFVNIDGVDYGGDIRPDGRHDVYRNGNLVSEPGFLPKKVEQRNSEYMADYADATVNQIRKWVEQRVLVNCRHYPEYEQHLGDYRTELKLTIEPSKPRLW